MIGRCEAGHCGYHDPDAEWTVAFLIEKPLLDTTHAIAKSVEALHSARIWRNTRLMTLVSCMPRKTTADCRRWSVPIRDRRRRCPTRSASDLTPAMLDAHWAGHNASHGPVPRASPISGGGSLTLVLWAGRVVLCRVVSPGHGWHGVAAWALC